MPVTNPPPSSNSITSTIDESIVHSSTFQLDVPVKSENGSMTVKNDVPSVSNAVPIIVSTANNEKVEIPRRDVITSSSTKDLNGTKSNSNPETRISGNRNVVVSGSVNRTIVHAPASRVVVSSTQVTNHVKKKVNNNDDDSDIDLDDFIEQENNIKQS
jgi:hypothetical protein